MMASTPAKPVEPKILVVGPGALGGLFAARLGRRWSGVYLLDHREDRAAQLQDRGLHVTGASMVDWTPPRGRVEARALGSSAGQPWPVMDAILFFVKAPAFAEAWKTVQPVTGPRTALVVFPETLDPSIILKSRARQVVSALTEDRARVEGLGRVVHETSGGTFLDAAAPLARAVAALFKDALIPVSLDKNISEKKWISLLAQVCVDVPAALTDVPQSRVLQPPLAPLEEGLLSECAAVAKALGRPVSVAVLRKRRDALVAMAPEAKSPLGRDLMRGRPTERSFLTEPLLSAAKKKKVPAPLLFAMDRLLRRLEREAAAP